MEDKNLTIVKEDEKIYGFTRKEIETIKATVAKGATDTELGMFLSLANQYGLNPLNKEIWFIKRVSKKQDRNGSWDYPRLANGEIDYSGAETLIMTSRDGYLKSAQRDTNFAGILSFAVREGDEFQIDAQNYTVNHKFGVKRGRIIGAWAKVEHKQRKAVIAYADFTEYNTPNNNIWKKYPSAMIQKVAEVFALKRQFGLNGLVTVEEMTQANMEYETQEKEIEKMRENEQKDYKPVSDKPVVDAEIIVDENSQIDEKTSKAMWSLIKALNMSNDNVLEMFTLVANREIKATNELTIKDGKTIIEMLIPEYRTMKEQEADNQENMSDQEYYNKVM